MQDARRQEIEAKRQRLVDLRRAREERRALLESERTGSTAASGANPQAGSPARPSRRVEVDSLVNSLLGPTPSSPSRPGSSENSTVANGAGGRSGEVSVPGTPSKGSSISSSREDGLAKELGRAESRTESVGVGNDSIEPVRSSANGLPEAQQAREVVVPPPPKAKVTYAKGVQTTFSSLAPADELDAEGFPAHMSSGAGTSTNPTAAGFGSSSSGRETEDEMRERIVKELEEEKRVLDAQIEVERARLEAEVEQDRLREMTDEQRSQIYSAPAFLEFVESSSRIVQRALSDGYDYIKDYTLGGDGGLDDDEGRNVKLVCTFEDDRWTKNRSVTGLDWSPKFPELSVASYNKNPSAVSDPDGLVCVWNLHLLDRPEFIFHSQTDVLSVSFSPFHSNLIFGGSYSGQILLWDTRAKHLPVLKTPLSAAGHTYPVYGMKMVGTQNAHNLITSSTDGMVCSWLADMLASPQETLDLRHPAHTKTDEVSITALDFPDNETTTFWVGTEEGNVYQANRYDRAGAKAGLNQHELYRAHAGPVTALDFHPLVGPVDFSDLFLTSSVDWTIKLWRSKGGSGSAASKAASLVSAGQPAVTVPPLCSFEENTDYVYDVRWHPVHPAVFGSVDGTGRFDLWNLNVDTEVPSYVTQTPSTRALNKLSWDKKDGRRAAVGSAGGSVYVYDIGDVASPRESEWQELQKTLAGVVALRDGDGLGLQ